MFFSRLGQRNGIENWNTKGEKRGETLGGRRGEKIRVEYANAERGTRGLSSRILKGKKKPQKT